MRIEPLIFYVEDGKGPAEEYRLGDSTGPRFKCIPSLGFGIKDIEETLAICFAHNLVRTLELHGDVGAARFTDT